MAPSIASVYQHPAYYERAFSFRDVQEEVDVFEALIRRHSRIPVTNMLEVACGPAPHLEALAQRGYTYIGIDLNQAMLNYARHKAQQVNAAATFFTADLRDFHLAVPVDFAFILLGSLYVHNTAELAAHFDTMATALRPGGLYLLDWCVDFGPSAARCTTWTVNDDDLTVKATYRANTLNVIEQTIVETLTLIVEDHDATTTLWERAVRREIYPQEFLLFCDQRPDFEFLGWWNDWDLTQPLSGTEPIIRPITVVRRI